MSNKKNRNRKFGVCVYCGREGQMTQEHVFPRAIFLGEEDRKDMITVLACNKCQQGKSSADLDLRNILALEMSASSHPNSEALMKRMLENASDARLKWLDKMINSAQEVDFISSNGILLGNGLEFGFNSDRVLEAQKQTVRALSFHHTGEVMAMDVILHAMYAPWFRAMNMLSLLDQSSVTYRGTRGNHVVDWGFWQLEDCPPGTGVWLIIYNAGVPFLITTGAVAERASKRELDHQMRQIDERDLRPSVLKKQIIVPETPDGKPIVPNFLYIDQD